MLIASKALNGKNRYNTRIYFIVQYYNMSIQTKINTRGYSYCLMFMIKPILLIQWYTCNTPITPGIGPNTPPSLQFVTAVGGGGVG